MDANTADASKVQRGTDDDANTIGCFFLHERRTQKKEESQKRPHLKSGRQATHEGTHSLLASEENYTHTYSSRVPSITTNLDLFSEREDETQKKCIWQLFLSLR